MADDFYETIAAFGRWVRKTYNRSIYPFGDRLILIRLEYREHKYHKGRIEMVLNIDDLDAIKKLNDPKTRQWLADARHWLDEFQGATPNSDAELANDVLSAHESGASDQNIADRINAYIAKLIKEYVALNQMEEKQRGDLSDDKWVRYLEEQGRNPYAAAMALSLMDSFGLNESDEFFRSGIQNIKHGHEPFLPGMPINRHRVRNQRIRWAKQRKERSA